MIKIKIIYDLQDKLCKISGKIKQLFNKGQKEEQIGNVAYATEKEIKKVIVCIDSDKGRIYESNHIRQQYSKTIYLSCYI